MIYLFSLAQRQLQSLKKTYLYVLSSPLWKPLIICIILLREEAASKDEIVNIQVSVG